jgi:hypothetical protein
MKLSLWQQFSSNHSATFMVVGQFEDETWAEMVEMEIKSILREFSDWWAQIPAEDRYQHLKTLQEGHQLTPAEQSVQQRYQIATWGWRHRDISLDWTLSDHAVEAVHRIGTMVTINQDALPMDSWAGPAPFEEILQKLGGAVYASCSQLDRDFTVTIRGTAENPEAARRIVSWTTVIERGTHILLSIPGHYVTTGSMSCDGSEVLLQGCGIASAYYGSIAVADLRPHHRIRTQPQSRKKPQKYIDIQSTFENDLQYLLQEFGRQGLRDITFTLEDTSRLQEHP